MPLFAKSVIDAFNLVDMLYIFNYKDIRIEFDRDELRAETPDFIYYPDTFKEIVAYVKCFGDKITFVASNHKYWFEITNINNGVLINKIPCDIEYFMEFNMACFLFNPKHFSKMTADYRVLINFLIGKQYEYILKTDERTDLIDCIFNDNTFSGTFYGSNNPRHWIIEGMRTNLVYHPYVIANACLNIIKTDNQYAITVTIDDGSVVVDNHSDSLNIAILSPSDINTLKSMFYRSEIEKSHHDKAAKILENLKFYAPEDFLQTFPLLCSPLCNLHYHRDYPAFYKIFKYYLV